VLLAPPLGAAALRFGSFEFFWLAVFGIVISGQLTGGTSPLKGYIAGILGLMVAMVGSDGIHAHVRFNLGFSELNGGIGLIPAMVGAFGFAEVLTVMWQRRGVLATTQNRDDRVLPRLSDLWLYKRTIGRSGVIGTLIGIIPGVGEDIGAWGSYAAARRSSRERDQFGSGSKEGLIAAEALGGVAQALADEGVGLHLVGAVALGDRGEIGHLRHAGSVKGPARDATPGWTMPLVDACATSRSPLAQPPPCPDAAFSGQISSVRSTLWAGSSSRTWAGEPGVRATARVGRSRCGIQARTPASSMIR